MANKTAVWIDSFEDVGPIKKDTPYETFRAIVLRAGRFSVFEATDNQTTARLYERLSRDPTVRLTKEGFPWTRVEAQSNV